MVRAITNTSDTNMKMKPKVIQSGAKHHIQVNPELGNNNFTTHNTAESNVGHFANTPIRTAYRL
jgi:hypothetical protein